MSTSEKSSGSANVSDSSKKLSTTSENIPVSEEMSQDEIASATPQEESTDDILMFSEFPFQGIVTSVLSESSNEEDPPLRRNLDDNVTASPENMLVQPSQLNRSPWNFVCNFRPPMYLKFAIKTLSNPEVSRQGSGRIHVDDNGFNITIQNLSNYVLARFRCTKPLHGKFSNLALSQELGDVKDEGTVYLGNHTGTDKVDIRVLAVEALSDSELNEQASGRMAVDDNTFNVTFQNSIQSALGHLRLNPARFRFTNPLNGKRFDFLVLAQESADIEDEGTVYLGNHTGTDKLNIHVLVVKAPSDDPELNDQASGSMAVDDDGFNVTVQNSIKSALAYLRLNPARFLCIKLLNGKRSDFLVLPQDSADIQDKTTASLANPEGSDTVKRFNYLVLPQQLANIEVEGSAAVDFPFIIELTRIHHFPPFGGVRAQVGQGNQQPAMIGGAGLGLGMMGQQNTLQGGPQAIPAVAQGVNVQSDFQILDIRVAATEDSNDNEREILRKFLMPENHATSWGWLAQEVYDEYLSRHPNHPIEDGIRPNPYVCWPGRSVSYTSLGGQLFVWPNSPWQTVKYGLKNITLRGGWV